MELRNQDHIEATLSIEGFGALNIKSGRPDPVDQQNTRALLLTFTPIHSSKPKRIIVRVNDAGGFEIEELKSLASEQSADSAYDGLGIA